MLTEAQVQALEKKKLDDEASGEIETAHPGYLGSQDTFYVGTIRGGACLSADICGHLLKGGMRKTFTRQKPDHSRGFTQ